jgi:nucleoporin GLE1
MGKMQLHTSELQKVRAFNRRSYYEGLEAWSQERTESDIAAIEAANARHESVRHDAEAVLDKYYQQQAEEERLRKAEEERVEKERQAFEKAERERKEREEAERQAKLQREKEAAAAKKAAEEEVKAAEEKAKADAEEARRKEREETATREKAEQDRAMQQATEKAAADTKARDDKAAQDQQAAAQAQANAAKAQASSSGTTPEILAEHKRYLDIHANLKKFRKEFMVHAKADPKLKANVGDMRRAIRTSVGQLTDSKEKGANTKPTQRVRKTLEEATNSIPSPSVNLTPYVYIDNKLPATHTDVVVPSLLIYLLSMFTKAVIAAFTGECAVNPKAAEPIGTLVAQIFAAKELQIQLDPSDPTKTTSLVSILMSKIHATCPPLFGITGDESTSAGRQALGWRREFTNNNASAKSHVQETSHYSRLVGLSAGFAAISLRNFAKTTLKNPYPPKNFWASLANIVNTPPARIQNSHLIVLKNMIEGGVERFLLFYGNVGVAALREALVVLPQKLQAQGKPKILEGSAGRGLLLLVDTLEKEKNLRL